jgi:glycosyltransferase involved in cell wall biosynthesis
MIILHVLAPAEVGGLERVVRSLVGGHCSLGHRVCVAPVLEPSASGHAFVRSLSQDAEVVPIPVTPRSYIAERRMIAALCGRLRPDVVHTHGYRADVVDAGVARRLGFATATTVHGFTGGDWKNRIYERLQRRAFRRFDAVVAVSRPLGDALRSNGVPPDRLHVIPNAWDGDVALRERAAARRELGLPAKGFRIGWVGRMTREKGPDVMLAALASLGDVPVTLSMVGDGDGRPGLRAHAETLGLEARTTWHGPMREAAALLPAFDVFVLSSRTEGTPMVLFEAMAAGVPVVATSVGGVPDVVSSVEALLVPSEDPAALAAAVRDTRANPEAARDRARAARRRLERDFALPPWLDRYETLYRAIAKRPTALVGT